jgi:hypothetical protein
VSKVFDNADFGFRQITVERPLRLNFQASPERIERLRDVSAFQNLARSTVDVLARCAAPAATWHLPAWRLAKRSMRSAALRFRQGSSRVPGISSRSFSSGHSPARL